MDNNNMGRVDPSQRLDSLKYVELQHLAKTHGLKANLKADKLVKSLREYFQQERKRESIQEDAVTTPASNGTDEETMSDAEGKEDGICVTQRRSVERQLSAGHTDSANETAATAHPPLPAQEPLVASPDREGFKMKRRQRKRLLAIEVVKPEGTPGLNGSNSPSSHASKRARWTDTSSNSKPALLRGKIPRYVGRADKAALKADTPSGKAGLKAGTPDWKKIHEANFNKMESIDKYVERKRRRIEAFGNSIKQVKPVSGPEQPTKALPVLAERRRSPRTSNSMVTGNASNTGASSTFKPSIFTVTKMNVRFTAATEGKESKLSLIKTPARRSPLTHPVDTPGSSQRRKIKDSVPKTNLPKTSEGITPYTFCGNATPGTNKKFDLKESLSRPLSYQPHKGKLKPWAEAKENVSSHSHCKDYKQLKLQTRAERREQHVEGRKEKKRRLVGARRGLVMA
ncbi:nucleolar and spindle-associated protein 1 [Callorhinchus milii]|uniref:nucleolar and spindle-associated protein 1 n=1 Tax=Callorhinchus milii TaxID=7868 RepID=UPI001C3FCFC5|nr:nucleolar and spindle-associated protein 1 [Callorhinchus milii]